MSKIKVSNPKMSPGSKLNILNNYDNTKVTQISPNKYNTPYIKKNNIPYSIRKSIRSLLGKNINTGGKSKRRNKRPKNKSRSNKKRKTFRKTRLHSK